MNTCPYCPTGVHSLNCPNRNVDSPKSLSAKDDWLDNVLISFASETMVTEGDIWYSPKNLSAAKAAILARLWEDIQPIITITGRVERATALQHYLERLGLK